MTLTMSWAQAQRAIGRPAATAHEAVQNAEQAAAIVPSIEEQHHGIEAALHDVNALVPTWQSTA